MKIVETEIPGMVEIQPQVFGDERGFFLEMYHRDKFSDAGLPTDFVQDNLSRSKRGTLRGLHYQLEHAQGKLVRVMSGVVYDVAVDLRKSSPAFGRWVGVTLSAEAHNVAYVPPGCAHGFLVLSESADFYYKCTDVYAPQHERTLLWNDPDVGVEWPTDDLGDLILSAKDEAGKRLSEADCYA